LITTFGARHAPGFWWSLLSAILGIAAGIVLLAWPVSGAVSLTLLLIVFFVIEGVQTSKASSSTRTGALAARRNRVAKTSTSPLVVSTTP
jgi:uncharacterized membrane protein HdeD (DUF308 family)